MTNFKTEIEKSGFVAFTSKGTSMLPLIKQDTDVSVIKKVDRELKKNDVVLFLRDNGNYILHRIIKLLPDNKYLICGDNRYIAETVKKEQIIGILSEVVKDGKKILMTDKKYKKYVFFVPLRRFFIMLKALPCRIKDKILRTFGRKT